MKRKYSILLLIPLLACCMRGIAQSNNALSIYEGEQIQRVFFVFDNEPEDGMNGLNVRQKVENTFLIYPRTHYSSLMADYYLSQINAYPFVERAVLNIEMAGEGGLNLTVQVELTADGTKLKKENNIFRNIRSFPVVLTSRRSFLTLRFSASEMAYSNNNAWFGEPDPLLAGNPLADNPVGEGYTGWLEGFGMGGVYGITKIIPRLNLHLYGGASYIASFSAGRELFTDQSRFHGEVEDAFAGIVGGNRTHSGHIYSYNILYGRKQFVLGNGWLIVNTSMNGQERAGLQLNPRWAARRLFQTGFRWDKMLIQGFQVRPNELPIFHSHTIINGLNIELGNNTLTQIGGSVLHAPRSDVKYYMPDGTVHVREGLWVYNFRLFGNRPANTSGLFYKAEAGYQTNQHFRMRAYAWYTQLGWNFTTTRGTPSLSYRFACFSGDDPKTSAYERWDALYTGGTGEQWVQGANMYKIVQNSNEMTHLLQLIYSPVRKIQTVTQLWSFIAPEKNNLGGNPGLSILKSNYYGTELNLTVKYFHSRHWYFHLNTAFTPPGAAIKDIVGGTKNWFCLMAFIRYSI